MLPDMLICLTVATPPPISVWLPSKAIDYQTDDLSDETDR